MKFLKEVYTRDEVKQRATDTRNIINALQDSLSIFKSALNDTDIYDEETLDKLSRYVKGYEADIEDMAVNFYDDFEDLLIDEPDNTEEIETETEEEQVEESLKKEGTNLTESIDTEEDQNMDDEIKTQVKDFLEMHHADIGEVLKKIYDISEPYEEDNITYVTVDYDVQDEDGNEFQRLSDIPVSVKECLDEGVDDELMEIREKAGGLVDALDELEDNSNNEFYVTWSFGRDDQGSLTGGVDVRLLPSLEDDENKIKEILGKVEKAFTETGFELDSRFARNPGKTLFGGWHYQVILNEELNENLASLFKRVHDEDEINFQLHDYNYENFYKELQAYAQPNENPEEIDPAELFKRMPINKQADFMDRFYIREKLYKPLKESTEEFKKKAFKLLDEIGGYSDYEGRIAIIADTFDLSKDEAEDIVWEWQASEEYMLNEGSKGSIEDYFSKMKDKSKPEAQKIVMKANGNPNAEEAYKKYLELNEDTIKTSDGKWTNKGDTGETHGKFKTKKEADAQRCAMFANGFKG